MACCTNNRQAKNPCLWHGSASLRLPLACTLGLLGAPPPGPLGLHPSSQCKYIVYPSSQHIVYPSEPHIVYPSYQYIAYPSQQYVVYPRQQLIVYPSQLSFFYPSQPHILLLHSSIYTYMYYPAVLPVLINHNPIPTHLKSEPMISLHQH